jgi:hypothetical protein
MDKRWIGGGAGLVALLLVVAWWMGWFHREDPLIAQTRAAIATMQEQKQEPAPEQRNALRAAWEDRMKGLNDEQRMAMFEQLMPLVMPMFMQQFEARYDKFMAMTPAEQRAELDKRIDEMQKRMASGQGGGGPFGGGGGGNRPQMDPAKAAEFQKKMLAWTTPEQRAKFQNGMMMFSNRMKERGLNPPPMPGGGFF